MARATLLEQDKAIDNRIFQVKQTDTQGNPRLGNRLTAVPTMKANLSKARVPRNTIQNGCKSHTGEGGYRR